MLKKRERGRSRKEKQRERDSFEFNKPFSCYKCNSKLYCGGK